MEQTSDPVNPVDEAAEDFFGISCLMPFQRLVISNITASACHFNLLSRARPAEKLKAYLARLNPETDRNDTDCIPHQLVLLPTGAGKSLCFMLPTFFLKGITLIIFPLIGLINDQFRRCAEAGISAVRITGGMSGTEKTDAFNLIRDNKVSIVLTNPEKLADCAFRKLLEGRISHIVIDEAHTASQWGDSFRPSFLALAVFLPELKAEIITAFTATASSHICARIREIIFSGRPVHTISQLTDRENIHYSVRRPLNKLQEILKIIKHQKNLPAIIFCSSRTGTEIIARQLLLYTGTDNIRFYHAGLTRPEKKAIENWFFESDNGVLCATCAYGLGVDKKNIRCVIHHDIPASMEAYLQESGRAGRDRKESRAVALLSRLRNCNNQSPLKSVFESTNCCRRKQYLAFLQQEPEHCSGCDICDNKIPGLSREEELLLLFVRKYSGRYTSAEAASLLYGRLDKNFMKPYNIRYFAILNAWDEHEILNLFKAASMHDLFFVPRTGPWKNHIILNNRLHRLLYRFCLLFVKLRCRLNIFSHN